MKNEALIQQAISILSKDECNEQAIDLLRRFLMSNKQQSSGKFNIYNYISKDGSRPALRCVYHSGGFRVATDSYILVALANQDYPEELEGKLLNKKAEEIEGIFPNWKRIIPDKSQAIDVWTISSRDTVADAVKQQKQIIKEKREAFVSIDLCGKPFNPDYLLKLIDFAKHIGVNELKVGRLGFGNSGTPYCACYGEDGSVGLMVGLDLSCDRHSENIVVTI